MGTTILSDPQKQFHAISLSGGKDSTAMLLLMIERGKPALEKPSSASKIFCRELDIRVAQIMEANTLLDACLRQQLPVNPGHRIQAPIAAGAGRREQDGIVGVLFMLPHQHIHRLLGQRHFADRVLCFQPCHHQFAIDTSDLLAHREYPVFHIQAIPRKCQQLSTP